MSALFGDARLPSRFWEKVRETPSCWLWTGRTTGYGYGSYWLDGHNRPAHRVAHEALVGPIAEGQYPDHVCRRKTCVNPAHIEVVSGRENTLRGVGPTAANAVKDRCPSGHALTPDNLVPASLKKGWRSCLTCQRRRHQEYKRRVKEASR